MYLSEQQRACFRTFGFLAFPGLFADQIAAITQAFEDVWQRHGGGHAGKAHDGTARSALVPFIDQDERHLEQVMANDGHLAELSRKARETMAEPARG